MEFEMDKGTVFTVTEDFISQLNGAGVDTNKLSVGQEFAVTKSNGIDTFASKFVDGKPSRGRPRKFPTNLLGTLLGVEVSGGSATTQVEETVITEEDRAARIERVDTLISAETAGAEKATDDNW